MRCARKSRRWVSRGSAALFRRGRRGGGSGARIRSERLCPPGGTSGRERNPPRPAAGWRLRCATGAARDRSPDPAATRYNAPRGLRGAHRRGVVPRPNEGDVLRAAPTGAVAARIDGPAAPLRAGARSHASGLFHVAERNRGARIRAAERPRAERVRAGASGVPSAWEHGRADPRSRGRACRKDSRARPSSRSLRRRRHHWRRQCQMRRRSACRASIGS